MSLNVYCYSAGDEHIRGYLDRFAIEVHAGVWLAEHSTRVRDGIISVLEAASGHALVVWAAGDGEGWGVWSRSGHVRVLDFHGLAVPALLGSIAVEDTAPVPAP